MNEIKPAFHGSDIEKVEKIYHIPAEQLTAFGSNVNPLGVSPKMRAELSAHIDVITTYPDRSYTALRDSICAYTGVPAPYILPGNGSTELISLAMEVTHPKHACILDPTYSEYSREISLSGGSCFSFVMKEEDGFRPDRLSLYQALSHDVDLLVLCNPNNPTGTALSRAELTEILTFCQKRHILVVIDETYAEFADDTESVSACTLLEQFPDLLILRGTSKFFAAPGLRLGYALCSDSALLKEMARLQNPWSVNSLAARAGEIMFADVDYIARTRQYICEERRRIYEYLKTIPALRPFAPAANFILVKILDEGKSAPAFFDYAIRRNLMIRDCSDFEGLGPQFFRFCFLDRQNDDRLLACIQEFFA